MAIDQNSVFNKARAHYDDQLNFDAIFLFNNDVQLESNQARFDHKYEILNITESDGAELLKRLKAGTCTLEYEFQSLDGRTSTIFPVTAIPAAFQHVLERDSFYLALYPKEFHVGTSVSLSTMHLDRVDDTEIVLPTTDKAKWIDVEFDKTYRRFKLADVLALPAVASGGQTFGGFNSIKFPGGAGGEYAIARSAADADGNITLLVGSAWPWTGVVDVQAYR